ncbi:MAG: BrnT family toxin [Methylocystis sp.]
MDVVLGNFEWDSSKDSINRQKHGVAFADAVEIFEGRYLKVRSDRSGETRWLAIGSASERVIAVIYAERGGRLRIISARTARKSERETYFKLTEDTS